MNRLDSQFEKNGSCHAVKVWGEAYADLKRSQRFVSDGDFISCHLASFQTTHPYTQFLDSTYGERAWHGCVGKTPKLFGENKLLCAILSQAHKNKCWVGEKSIWELNNGIFIFFEIVDFRRRSAIDNDKVISGRLKHYTNSISKTKGSSEESMQQSESRTHEELRWYRCMLSIEYWTGQDLRMLADPFIWALDRKGIIETYGMEALVAFGLIYEAVKRGESWDDGKKYTRAEYLAEVPDGLSLKLQ